MRSGEEGSGRGLKSDIGKERQAVRCEPLIESPE